MATCFTIVGMLSKQSDNEWSVSHISFCRKRKERADWENGLEMRGTKDICVPNQGLSNA